MTTATTVMPITWPIAAPPPSFAAAIYEISVEPVICPTLVRIGGIFLLGSNVARFHGAETTGIANFAPRSPGKMTRRSAGGPADLPPIQLCGYALQTSRSETASLYATVVGFAPVTSK